MPYCPVCRSPGRAGARWENAGECGHAELDCGGLPPQGRVDLGELVVGAGEADLQSVDFAEPALAFGFGDAVVQVGADLREPGALCGVWPQERAPDVPLTELTDAGIGYRCSSTDCDRSASGGFKESSQQCR